MLAYNPWKLKISDLANGKIKQKIDNIELIYWNKF
jgi:hypothetical protein